MIKQKDFQLTFRIKLSAKAQYKQCYLVYRPVDKQISILDSKTRKTLYHENEIQLQDNNLIIQELILGNSFQLIINSANIANAQIISYCDEFTKNTLTNKSDEPESVLLMVKPGLIESGIFGQILSVIEQEFQIIRFKMFNLTKLNLARYIVNQKMQNSENDKENMEYLSSGPCFGFEIGGQKLLSRLRKLLGPQNPIQAKKTQPLSLRAKYGANIIRNCCHSSKNQKQTKLELEFVFSRQVQEVINRIIQLTPQLKNSCLCLIKPHVIKDKKSGQLITALLQKGILITCMRFNRLKLELVKKYLDLYKFLPEYSQNIALLSSDSCIIMEVTIPKVKSVVEEFKKICGPYDPSYAKKTSPQSIRAMFGFNRVLNAVHTTQLQEDSESELQIMFQS